MVWSWRSFSDRESVNEQPEVALVGAMSTNQRQRRCSKHQND
jgi:hypothetical protein